MQQITSKNPYVVLVFGVNNIVHRDNGHLNNPEKVFLIVVI